MTISSSKLISFPEALTNLTSSGLLRFRLWPACLNFPPLETLFNQLFKLCIQAAAMYYSSLPRPRLKLLVNPQAVGGHLVRVFHTFLRIICGLILTQPKKESS